MKKLKFVLALITQDNDYQREQAAVAETTAQRLGMDLQVFFANNDAIAQTKQILSVVHGSPSDRPDAVIVEPVGTGMPQVAQAAVHNGVGWVVLNREADYLTSLRQASSAPVGSVDCDNVEVGRIQGRQFAALLPGGGHVWYIEGPATEVSKLRRVGVDETLPSNIELQPGRGRWTEESGYSAINSRLLLQGAQKPSVGIIGCQNDAMAVGARKAVEALTVGAYRDQWLKIPLTGCDGVPSSGQTWVREGLLAATVITPALTGLAIELVSKAIASGSQMPERTLTKPVSFPPVEELSLRALGSPAR